ncbi:hypothetical protein [Bacillus sp. AK128]
MKKFFEDVSKEVVPKVKQSLQIGQKLLSSILNKVDSELTKTIKILIEKQDKIKQFIQDKDLLLKEIERKEFEVSQLREQINHIKSQSQNDQLDSLRDELNHKLDDLLNSQHRYYELESKIEAEQKRVEELVLDKQNIERDRNALKARYEKIKVTLADNRNKTNQLEKEIKDLQERQLHYETLLDKSVSNEEIQKYEQLLKDMQREYESKIEGQMLLKDEFDRVTQEQKEMEQSLLKKMTEITKLSNELNASILTLEETKKEKTSLKSKLQTKEKALKQSKKQILTLQEELVKLKQLQDTYELKYQTALQDYEKERDKLAKNYEDFTNDMALYEERIQDLQNELIDKQNEIAIAKAENGEAEDLSEEEYKIMEREFEPRFNNLYKNCKFHPEFLSDFFRITPSDRLKVEVVIMNLNYHYDVTTSNVRKNPIKTKTSTILEYPFGTDSVGRIYFNKENHTVHLYRLSRTKNGRGKLTQDHVIEWLKVNR